MTMLSLSRRAAAVIVAGAVATSMTACGTKVDNPGGTSATAAATKNLVYKSAWGADEPQAKILKAALDDFAKAEDVTVDVQFLGRKGVDNLATEMAAGTGPDLYDAAIDNLPGWRAKNLVADLSDVLKAKVAGEDKTVGDVLSKAVIAAASDDKGLGFMPHTVTSSAVWYNATANPDLAANPPKTWDEFLAFLNKQKAAGKTGISQDGTIAFYNVYWFYSALVNANGQGALGGLAKDAANWDKPEVLEAATKIEQLAKGGYFQKDFMATKFPAAQDAWAKGEAAFNINGTWVVSEVSKVAPADAKFRSFPLPAGGKKSVEVGSLGLAVNPKGKNVENAKKFLTYMLKKDHLGKIATEALNIPSRSDIAAPEFLADAQKAINSATATHSTYDGAAGDKAFWNDMFLPLDDQLLSGQITAAQFVAQGKEKTKTYLATKG